MIGTTLSHYKLLSTLGSGGMGVVYRANDTKLGRDVALKVLPAEMASDPERIARFQREARAVAALNHPHIVTIYSVEEVDGVHFLTMELIEGQPLGQQIPASGLPAERIIEIAGALADALSAAHEKGILHRDLKPANVMLTSDGRAKILDFGLAKDVSVESSSGATLTSAGQTQAGIVMGTPAYMSPEQVSGRVLDQRTDIFSLGVVLHEMATGKQPFEGQSSAELISAILRDSPPLVTEIRPDLPADLARIIRRCLEKDPRYRMQTARDVSNEFRDLARLNTRIVSGITSTSRAVAVPDSGVARADEGFWVAVLPFKCAGSSADLKSLAEGLSEEVITGLSRFSYLRVIALSSTTRYSSESGDVRAVGKELGARYVMEGTLRQAGTRLRLAVQLLDAISGAHLWAENFERAFSSDAIFELQDDLVPRIVSTVADMNGALPRSMSDSVRSRPPELLSAYEAVLRSFGYTYSATPEELAAARSGLEEAVRKAPAYSDAWAMLSFLCGQDYVHGYELQANALEAATSAARRAVALGASNHLAYFSLAQALWCQKDYDSFQDAVERAIALNPMDGNSVAYLGELLTYAGRAERGMQLVERAKQLNPNHPGWYWFADFYHAYSRGEYRAALSFALKAKLRGNPLAPMFVAAAAGQLGEAEVAAQAAADLVKFRPELPAVMPKQVAKVWDPEYGRRFLQGLRKAGLKIPEPPVAALAATSPDSGAIRALSSGAISIAVLPLINATGNPELDYVGDSIAEAVIDLLADFAKLRVVPRSKAFRSRDLADDPQSAGRTLEVQAILTGRITKRGEMLAIRAELIDVAKDAQLWGAQFSRSINDAVELQQEIARKVAEKLAGAPSGSIKIEAAAQAPTVNKQAYQLFLRGAHHANKWTAEGLHQGIELYRQAIDVDPMYAQPYAGMAIAYPLLTVVSRVDTANAFRQAKACARRAIELDDTLSEAHAALGLTVMFCDFNLAGALMEGKRAAQLDSGSVITRYCFGQTLAASGRIDEAIEVAREGCELDPLMAPINYGYGLILNYARRWDEAVAQYRRTLEISPNFFLANAMLGVALARAGHAVEAMDHVNRPFGRPDPVSELVKGHVAAILGERALALSILAKREAAPPAAAAYFAATIYGFLGDLDNGFVELQRTWELRFPILASAKVNPSLDPFRSDRRWEPFLKSLNLGI